MLFALIGLIITSTIAHEAVHWMDYHATSYEDRICVINILGNWSGFGILQSPFAEYITYTNNHEDHGEFKAYAVSTILLMIFTVAEMIVLNAWIKNGKGDEDEKTVSG